MHGEPMPTTNVRRETRRASGVRLSQEHIDELDRLGVDLDRSRSYLVRKAVQEFLERHRARTAES